MLFGDAISWLVRPAPASWLKPRRDGSRKIALSVFMVESKIPHFVCFLLYSSVSSTRHCAYPGLFERAHFEKSSALEKKPPKWPHSWRVMILVLMRSTSQQQGKKSLGAATPRLETVLSSMNHCPRPKPESRISQPGRLNKFFLNARKYPAPGRNLISMASGTAS